jgi:hypothetical protein
MTSQDADSAPASKTPITMPEIGYGHGRDARSSIPSTPAGHAAARQSRSSLRSCALSPINRSDRSVSDTWSIELTTSAPGGMKRQDPSYQSIIVWSPSNSTSVASTMALGSASPARRFHMQRSSQVVEISPEYGATLPSGSLPARGPVSRKYHCIRAIRWFTSTRHVSKESQ